MFWIPLGVLAIATACASSSRPPPAPPTDVQQLIMEDPAYRDVQCDAVLEEQFQRYVTWLQSLEIPDVVYLAGLPTDDLEHVAMLFHEKVELRSWLRQGHRFEDVMNPDYYRRHYETVYPVAHAEAMLAELALLDRFARRVGVPPVSARAFVLVGPMVERRQVLPEMVDRRLRFNPDIGTSRPTRDDLERATRVYEAGGYHYRDRRLVIDRAWSAVNR